MRKLRITSPLGYHSQSKEEISAYIKGGLLAHKELGFDGVDFSTQLLELVPGKWEAVAEQAVRDSKEIGMPFVVLGVIAELLNFIPVRICFFKHKIFKVR